MEKHRGSSFRLFGVHSIFVKAFIGLTLLCLVLMAFFYQVVAGVLVESQQEREQTANLSMLDQIADSVDLNLSIMSQSMSQTIWSTDIIAFLVNPFRQTSERESRIVRILDNSARDSELILSAHLYSPLSETLYNSDSLLTTLAHYADHDAVAFYLQNPASGERSSRDTISRVVVVENRIFIFTDLLAAKHLGTLYYELDPQALYRIINGESTEDSTRIHVYDAGGNRIFQMGAALTPPPDFASPELFLSTESPADAGDARYYTATSRQWGWRYVRAVRQGNPRLTARTAAKLLLPLLAVLLAISLLFTFYITATVYRPINRLMRSIEEAAAEHSPARPAARSEIDYLEHAYQDSIGRQSALSGLVHSISPDILEHLLRGLLMDKAQEESYVAQTLSGIGNPIRMDSRYCVIVGMTKSPHNRPSTNTEVNLYYISIRRILESLSNPAATVVPVSIDLDSIVIVLSCDNAQPVMLFKKAIAETMQEISRHVQNYPYEFVMGRGRIYNHIRDLKYSYAEAVADLQHLLYNRDGGDSSSASETDTLQVTHYYIKRRSEHIFQAIARNQTEEAAAIARRVVEEIATGQDSEAATLYGFLTDELMERLIVYQVSDDELADLRHFRIRSGGDCALLQQEVQAFCEQAIALVSRCSNKNQYKYIADAKEYIAENYANSSLSLNDVSAHVGIHSTYLSELFSRVAREPFNDFLSTYRVDKAKQMLVNTGLTAKEVGFKCGFNSAQNFIRVFKKITGMTPGHYRELNRQ